MDSRSLSNEDSDFSELEPLETPETSRQSPDASPNTPTSGPKTFFRVGPGRVPLPETVFFHGFIRAKACSVKTEYVRIKVIRGHKRWLRTLNLDRVNAEIQRAQGTPQGHWLLQLRNTYQENPPLFKKISKATSPSKNLSKNGLGFKSFNKAFCSHYFKSDLVRKSYYYYVEYLFSPPVPTKLAEYFRMSCCGYNRHNLECDETWTILKHFLQFTMIDNLGLEPYSEVDPQIFYTLRG